MRVLQGIYERVSCRWGDMVQGEQSSCAWTHWVSNLTLGTLSLENQYGRMTDERLISMFNFIELKGGNRRK
jgi:hypothetical protein